MSIVELTRCKGLTDQFSPYGLASLILHRRISTVSLDPVLVSHICPGTVKAHHYRVIQPPVFFKYIWWAQTRNKWAVAFRLMLEWFEIDLPLNTLRSWHVEDDTWTF